MGSAPSKPEFTLLELSELRLVLLRTPRLSRPAEEALGKIESWFRAATEEQ